MMAKLTNPHPSREKRVAQLALGMGIGGGLLAAIGAVALNIGLKGNSEPLDFIKGFGIGILSTLPVFFAVMTYRAITLMDEYAQKLQLQALAFAFMITMILSGSLIALQGYFHFNLPAWIIYAAGMLTWALAALVQNRRAGKEP